MATSSAPGAAPFVPEQRTLPVLQQAVQKCHGCDLYRNATQAVFGELETGPKSAKTRVSLMMIGEQPGDQEDKQGRPFVGPAGKLLDQCLEEAGIVRSSVYVTNTVKHFKWEPRGKLRIHKKPGMQEIRACRPWLQAELETVRPKLIVCLGGGAAEPVPHDACTGSMPAKPAPTRGAGRRGLVALEPGDYTVQLTVDGKTYTQPAVVAPDPRGAHPYDADEDAGNDDDNN